MPKPPAPGPELEFSELFPKHRKVAVGELLASLNMGRESPPDRPHTAVNFIASVDGRAAFKGRSGQLGELGDRAMFHGLREHADAVFAGTGTIRTERYGRLVNDPERRKRRAAIGLSPEPLACIISRTGDVPTEIPMFAEPESRIVIFTSIEPDLSGAAADVSVVRLDPGEVTLTTMLRRLRADFDVRALLCEGGPTVFGALLHERLVDELFLTISPKLAGGGMDPTTTSGPVLDELAPLKLRWALEREGFLFLRYALQ
ncbi:MAG: dihydrofolate reductase family protein [Solirubrobacteraceae bacterium]